jgi:hypothetical protein
MAPDKNLLGLLRMATSPLSCQPPPQFFTSSEGFLRVPARQTFPKRNDDCAPSNTDPKQARPPIPPAALQPVEYFIVYSP